MHSTAHPSWSGPCDGGRASSLEALLAGDPEGPANAPHHQHHRHHQDTTSASSACGDLSQLLCDWSDKPHPKPTGLAMQEAHTKRMRGTPAPADPQDLLAANFHLHAFYHTAGHAWNTDHVLGSDASLFMPHSLAAGADWAASPCPPAPLLQAPRPPSPSPPPPPSLTASTVAPALAVKHEDAHASLPLQASPAASAAPVYHPKVIQVRANARDKVSELVLVHDWQSHGDTPTHEGRMEFLTNFRTSVSCKANLDPTPVLGVRLPFAGHFALIAQCHHTDTGRVEPILLNSIQWLVAHDTSEWQLQRMVTFHKIKLKKKACKACFLRFVLYQVDHVPTAFLPAATCASTHMHAQPKTISATTTATTVSSSNASSNASSPSSSSSSSSPSSSSLSGTSVRLLNVCTHIASPSFGLHWSPNKLEIARMIPSSGGTSSEPVVLLCFVPKDRSLITRMTVLWGNERITVLPHQQCARKDNMLALFVQRPSVPFGTSHTPVSIQFGDGDRMRTCATRTFTYTGYAVAPAAPVDEFQ